MRNESIEKIMTVWPATVAPNDATSVARELFVEHEIHHLPVVDESTLVGMLSAADFLKLAMFDSDSSSVLRTRVRHIMSINPVVIHIDSTLRDAAEKLAVGEFHALPVIDNDSALVGIVTSSDLIRHMLKFVEQGDGSLR